MTFYSVCDTILSYLCIVPLGSIGRFFSSRMKNYRCDVGGAQPLFMQKQTIKRIHSFIALPLLAFSFGGSGVEAGTFNPFDMPSIQINMSTTEVASNPSDSVEYRAALIDSYFAARHLPLAGYGKEMVLAADKYGIDWRLLPAIAMRESTAGEHACGGKLSAEWNPWGWNSCKGTGFSSMEVSIDTLAKHLSGNHPNTARYYDGKTTEQVLKTYNPDHIVKGYSDQVIKIMNTIATDDPTTNSKTS